MLFARRIWNWCCRFRHRCGYGVHSPSDFFLITSVIYEDLPYYAYERLKASASSKTLPHYREKVNRLLFRLVNYFRPKTLVEVGKGNGDAFRYMQAARSSMDAISVDGSDWEEVHRQLEKVLKRMKQVDFLHIAYTPYYKEVFEAIFPYLHQQSIVVIGDIYASKERKVWWKQLTIDERIRLTFDLYDLGLMFLDTKRYKQNFTVNFF